MAQGSAGIELTGCSVRPTAPTFEPIARNRPSKGIGSRFKVVVFNARGGKHLDAIAERLGRPPLAEAGVILLCELDWRLKRSGMREVAADLAARLSMSFAFAPEYGFPRRDGITSFLGNAILSAEPLTEIRAVPITSLYDWTRHHPGDVKDVRAIGARTALIAAINLGRTRVTLGVAHLERLTSPAGRAIQMAALIAAIPTHGPAVIGGDFNTTGADLSRPRELARLALRLLREPRWLQRPESHEPLFEQLIRVGFTFEGANLPLAPTFAPAAPVPRFIRPKLDWVATRGLRPLPHSARVVCATRSWSRRISDHDFIACDLEL